MYYDHLDIGDCVSWEAINRTYSGIVYKQDDKGCHVALDGTEGKVVVLSTLRAKKAQEDERKRKEKARQSWNSPK